MGMVRTSPRAWLSVLLVATFTAAGLAGCLGNDPDPEDLNRGRGTPTFDLKADTVDAGYLKVKDLSDREVELRADFTIHIVTVGLDLARINPTQVEEYLPDSYEPIDRLRSFTMANSEEDWFHFPINYTYEYAWHQAPDAFAQDLFSFAETVSRKGAEPGVPSIGPAPIGTSSYLCSYDRSYEHNRLSDHTTDDCTSVAGQQLPGASPLADVNYIDVTQVENWIAGNRSAHDLEFEKPSYTFFVLDHWTQAYLNPEEYWYWEYKEDLNYGTASQTLRTWGGNYDFLFIDYSAAPNSNGNDESPTHINDPPIWDYDGGNVTEYIDCGTALELLRYTTQGAADTCVYDTTVLEENLGSDLAVGLQMRMNPSFLYFPEYKPTYFINVHFYKEKGSLIEGKMNNADLFDLDETLDRLSSQIPWARFDGKVTFYELPEEDPEFYQVLESAKAQAAESSVPTAPIVDYVTANPDKYLAGGDDAFNVRVMYVAFAGHYSFVIPGVLGIAHPQPDGKPWGVLGGSNDAFSLLGLGLDYNSLTAHEAGHFWGLNHPHDGTVCNQDGDCSDIADYTWDATSTPLSYRMVPYYSDEMDRELMAKGHTLLLVQRALKNLQVGYETLGNNGISLLSKPLIDGVVATEESLNTAVAQFASGRFIDAVYAAQAAENFSASFLDAAGEAQLQEVVVEEWDGTVTGAAKAVPFLINYVSPNGLKDYRMLEVEDTWETVTIEVTWSNSGPGYADMATGWDFYDPPRRFLTLPGGAVQVSDNIGVFNAREEMPGETGLTETLLIDMDDVGFRDRGVFYAGAASLTYAGAVDYHVKITATQRVTPFADA